MASLVLGVVGGAIGFMVGGPAGAAEGFMLGSAVGGVLFPPKGPDGPRLNDLTVQSSTYGKTIPITYGTVRVAGNIIWADKIQEHAQDQGGKGGPSYTTYSYTCSFATSICEGPIAGITRIWADGLLIYDKRPTNTGKQVGFKAGSYKIYLGDETQMPDPTIQAIQGDTPAYRGQAYMVFTDLQLEKFGNRIPSLSFEVIHKKEQSSHAPVKYGVGLRIAQDPVTGYIYATGGTYNNSVNIYDPTTYALLQSIPMPQPSGYNPAAPTGIVYADGKFIVGDSTANFYPILGWEITPLRDGAPATATIISGTMNLFPPPTGAVFPGGAYFWPGIPTRENYFFGTGGLAGGRSWTQQNPVTGLRADGPYLGTYAGNVLVSPDGTTEVIVGVTNIIAFTNLDQETGDFTFSQYLQNADWDSTQESGNRIAFDDANHVLYWGNVNYPGVYRVDRATGAMTLVIPGVRASILLYSPDTQQLYVMPYGGDFTCYTISDTGVVSLQDTFPGSGGVDSIYDGTAIYLGNEHWAWASQGKTVWDINFGNALLGQPALLADIVRDVSLRCQLTDADIGVSELTDLVDGYTIGHQMAGRSAIEPLQQAYFFDPVESDYTVAFRKRGRPAVATIPDDDLAAHSAGSEVPDLIQIKRKQEVDLPQQVSVKYINPDADYQTSVQYSRRMTGRSSSAVTVDLAIVMKDDKAMEVATAAQYSAWAERTGLTFATSQKYASLEPTDMAVVHNRLVRIVHKKRSGGMLEWEAYADGNTIYPTDSVTQGGTSAPAGPVAQPIVTTPQTQLVAIDAPIAADGTTGAVMTFAVQGQATGFTGAQIWKSIDGGASYQPIASAPNASLIGNATTVLGNYSGSDTFDETNTVTVRLLPSSSGATLSSATELAVLNGANAALLGAEVIQYKRAVLNADGTYTLSGLLRYRRGTDYATHQANEWFVPLTSNLVQIAVSTSEIGLPREYKAVSVGGSLADAEVVTLTYTGNDLKPYSPVHIGGWRDAAGDLTLTWVRRTRVGGEWKDGVDAQLGETSEAYDVEILSGAGGSVVRTFSGVTSPTVFYSAAQQVTDFGSAQSTVYVRVYQLSSVVGRGFPGTGSV